MPNARTLDIKQCRLGVGGGRAMAGYREIADDLRAGILRGDYLPGQTIPKLEELQQQYGVNKETARRAVTVLRAEGLVTPVTRRGTVVRDRSPVRLDIARHADMLAAPGVLGPWETACALQGVLGRTDLISVTRHPADPEVAAHLEVPVGTDVVCRLQHMYAGDEVAQVQRTWLPHALTAGTVLEGDGKITGGLYRALAGLGHTPSSASETVTARMPTREQAQVMGLDVGRPVLVIDRTTRDPDGTVLTFAQAVLVGDRAQATYDQTLGGAS